jgi:hypothetical protein
MGQTPLRLATFRRKNVPSDIGRLTLSAADMIFGGDFAPVHFSSAMRVDFIGLGALSCKIRHANRSLASVLPNSQYRTLEGQTHMLKPKAHAPVLVEFFKD